MSLDVPGRSRSPDIPSMETMISASRLSTATAASLRPRLFFFWVGQSETAPVESCGASAENEGTYWVEVIILCSPHPVSRDDPRVGQAIGTVRDLYYGNIHR